MILSSLLTISLLVVNLDLNPAEIRDAVQTGLDYAYVEKFDTAEVFFRTIIDSYPENPAGYFFQGALLQLRMMDECHNDYEREYLQLMNQAERITRSILDEEENLWAEFYLGSVYTYRAVYEGYRQNYFETFKYGVKGGSMLQSVIKKDSTFYDAYLGAGTYEYFWVRASRFLPVLKLTGGNLSEAIRKLQVAARYSIYSGPTALNSLVFVYSEEKKFTDADTIIETLLKKYPGSRTFLWNKAELAFKKGDYSTALEAYTELYERYHNNSSSNYSNMAQCKLQIGRCYLKLDEMEQARNSWKEVVSYSEHGNRYPRIKDYCREAYILLSRNL